MPTDGARVFVTPVDLGLGGDFLAPDNIDANLIAARFDAAQRAGGGD